MHGKMNPKPVLSKAVIKLGLWVLQAIEAYEKARNNEQTRVEGYNSPDVVRERELCLRQLARPELVKRAIAEYCP